MNEIEKHSVTKNLIDSQIQEIIENDAEIKNTILSNPETLQKLIQANIIDELKEEIKHEKIVLSFNYHEEKELFLNQFESRYTRENYSQSLKQFESFCKAQSIKSPLGCSSFQADSWIYNQRKENKSSATIHRNISGVSSFFSYMERKSNHEIINIFRGTKARSRKERKIQNKFYSLGNIDSNYLSKIENDFEIIIENVNDPEFKAIIKMMYKRGLRAGAFKNLSIHGEQFRTISKGKNIIG